MKTRTINTRTLITTLLALFGLALAITPAQAADRWWDGGTTNLGGTADKAGVTLGGSTTGNTVSQVTYVGGNRYSDLRKQGSGTWTVTGSTKTGTIRLSAGTLLLNGTVDCDYQGFVFTGGTLGGNGTIRENVTVPATGRIAPGVGAGILSFVGTLDLSAMSAAPPRDCSTRSRNGRTSFRICSIAAMGGRSATMCSTRA